MKNSVIEKEKIFVYCEECIHDGNCELCRETEYTTEGCEYGTFVDDEE